jgi:hypothetical protein
MTVRFTPLGKGSNRRSWHMYAPCSDTFKLWIQEDEAFRLAFENILENPHHLRYKEVAENGN